MVAEKVIVRRAVALLSRACLRSETAADHAASVASPRSLPSSKGAVRVLDGAEPPLRPAASTVEGMGLFRLRVKNGAPRAVSATCNTVTQPWSSLQHDTRARTMTGDDRHQYCRHIMPCSLRERLPPCASLRDQCGSALIACSGLFELLGCEWPQGLLGKSSGASVWSVRLSAGSPVDCFGRRRAVVAPQSRALHPTEPSRDDMGLSC